MTGMDSPSPEASAQQGRVLELELVARLRAGDAVAFEAVHTAFNTRLFNFLARLSRNRDLAEDLLEETWLRVVEAAPRLREDTRLGPFLFTIARNLYISYCRSRSLEDQHAPALIGLWPSGTPGPSPLDTTIARETGERVDLALASLPATYREALLLVAFEELKPAEAAMICGVSSDAMRQRVSRARAMIAERLDDRDEAFLLSLKAVTT